MNHISTNHFCALPQCGLSREFMFEGCTNGGGVIQCTASEASLVAILASRMRMANQLREQGQGIHVISLSLLPLFDGCCAVCRGQCVQLCVLLLGAGLWFVHIARVCDCRD